MTDTLGTNAKHALPGANYDFCLGLPNLKLFIILKVKVNLQVKGVLKEIPTAKEWERLDLI